MLGIAAASGCSLCTCVQKTSVLIALTVVNWKREAAVIFRCQQSDFLNMRVPNFYTFPISQGPLPSLAESKNPGRMLIVPGSSAAPAGAAGMSGRGARSCFQGSARGTDLGLSHDPELWGSGLFSGSVRSSGHPLKKKKKNKYVNF